MILLGCYVYIFVNFIYLFIYLFIYFLRKLQVFWKSLTVYYRVAPFKTICSFQSMRKDKWDREVNKNN